MEPTKEQIRELLRWFGYYGSIPNVDSLEFLGFLFKYAVPKLIPLDDSGQGGVEFRFYPGGTSCILTLVDEAGFNEEDYFLKNSHDPALALFWAWDKVRRSQ